ncbi:MAG: diphthamide biosynthesis enzyme Dph2 [Thermoplasmata archaeon]|nr:diphthamide biosynthesis enzyme Dph2 [Thermoplasmata archaeon]MCI4359824.1 diphthamide biosynthesis enzyme Dph2 [Thermoplasmata archaeon]
MTDEPVSGSSGLSFLDPASPEISRDPPSIVLPRFDRALFEAVRRAGHSKVALQVPAGLVRNAHDLAAELGREAGVSVELVVRACFGACDFPGPSEVPDADALVVLGHSPIPNVPRILPTYFVEMRYPVSGVGSLAETIVQGGVPSRLGLVASVQHLDLVDPLRRALAERGVALEVGRGDRRLAYAAQALGCNYTSAQSLRESVDAYLFLGTGRFHPIGLAFAVNRPVWSLDPLQGALEPPIDRASLVRGRQMMVARAMDARRFGVLVSSFAGQNRSGMATTLVERARRRGREAEILRFARLEPADLEGRDLDAYVNTACPRIALDDSALYARPMLTPPEFLMALGELPLDPYRFDTYH